jgi:multidrug efflux system membrane fusion protein
VRAGDPTGIVVITQIKPISVFFNLPQQQLNQVNKALTRGPLQVETLALDNKTVLDRGTLQVVDNQVDPTTIRSCSCGRVSSSMCGC